MALMIDEVILISVDQPDDTNAIMLDTIEVIILTIDDQIALMNAEIADIIVLVTVKSKVQPA